MSFLDRFKPQPRWRHSDATIRAAAIAEIPDDAESLATIRELAASDEDVRVRRAAAERLERAADLLPLARAERDEELRRTLLERLVTIASAADGVGDAAVALEGLEDQRHLATIAKSSPHDTIRTVALSRVHETRALGSVARHAAHGSTALEAVLRLGDRAELLNVALKTDHKDAGIAALERAVEASGATNGLRDTLESVTSRARNKSVAKKARGMMQALDEAEAAKKLALETWQQRVASLVARIETLMPPQSADAAGELDAVEAEWAALATEPAFELDAASVARFEAGAGAARAAIVEQQRIEAERRAEDEMRAARRASRRALLERVNGLRGDDILDEIERAPEEWAAIRSTPEDPDAAEMQAAFDAAVASARQRHQNRLDLQQTHARLQELAAEAERLSGEEALQREAWTAVASEWDQLLLRSDDLDAAVREQFEQAQGRVRQKDEERQAAAERARRQQLQRVEQLIERAQKRSSAEDLTLREADRLSRDLRSVIEAPPETERDVQQALIERVRAAAAVVAPRVHDLREMDEWKRFANAAVQEELIAKAEALRVKYGFDAPEGPKEDDLDKAARELHDIQERWKSVAEAPRAQAQALWHRYRQAADPVQARLREFFSHRNEERKVNLDKKLALIARAEQIADSTDWIKTADELKKLQAEWQQIGPVPRQDTKTTWKQFRDACDRFFTRRNADLAERKETWSANLARKEALCARAEELAASREWDRAAAEIRRLQTEWKTIGPVRRNKSEAVWQRFRSACDTFFDRYKRRDEIELESKQADREQLVAELEALGPVEGSGMNGADPSSLLEQVRSLRSRWNQSTPVVRHGADPLSARFVGALERTLLTHPDAFKGTELDIEPNRQKMEKLVSRVEAFLTEAAPAANSSQALADMLREALASNTIGGRAGEESKWRAMAEDVRQAQASFSRLGPVPGETGRALNERFHKAITKFFDQYRRKVPPQQTSSRGARPVGTR